MNKLNTNLYLTWRPTSYPWRHQESPVGRLTTTTFNEHFTLSTEFYQGRRNPHCERQVTSAGREQWCCPFQKRDAHYPLPTTHYSPNWFLICTHSHAAGHTGSLHRPSCWIWQRSATRQCGTEAPRAAGVPKEAMLTRWPAQIPPRSRWYRELGLRFWGLCCSSVRYITLPVPVRSALILMLIITPCRKATSKG